MAQAHLEENARVFDFELDSADLAAIAAVQVLQCFTVCCSVLQCVAVCCRVLQCVAVFGSVV